MVMRLSPPYQLISSPQDALLCVHLSSAVMPDGVTVSREENGHILRFEPRERTLSRWARVQAQFSKISFERFACFTNPQ